MTKLWNWLRAGIAAAIALGTVGIWFSIADYQATQGSGTTFGSKVLGGIHFPSFTLCDQITGGQCASIAATGQVSISNTSYQNSLDSINTNLQASIPFGTNLIGYVGVKPLSPTSGSLVSSSSAISAVAMPAQGASLRFYMTDFSCANTGVSTTAVHFLNAGSNTPLWTSIIPNSGGTNKTFNSPISTTANTAMIVSTLVASNTVYCTVAGFPGT